jgi:hypothetical protein
VRRKWFLKPFVVLKNLPKLPSYIICYVHKKKHIPDRGSRSQKGSGSRIPDPGYGSGSATLVTLAYNI